MKTNSIKGDLQTAEESTRPDTQQLVVERQLDNTRTEDTRQNEKRIIVLI